MFRRTCSRRTSRSSRPPAPRSLACRPPASRARTDSRPTPRSAPAEAPGAQDASGTGARTFDLPITETPAGRKDTRGVEIDHARTDRTTFIVTPDGRVAATVGGVAPDANVLKALEIVQQLSSGKARKS